MIYGYARVSSKGQDLYGNSLERQQEELRNAGCMEIYHDSYTGTKMDRPQFSVLIEKLNPGDTLVVTKLDRFARNASDGAKMVDGLVKSGVSVRILNMGMAENTSMGRLMVHMLFAFAEFERDMIVERTQMGKAVAKANNPDWKVGRKEIRVDMDKFKELLRLQKRRKVTVKECCKQLGISETTWRNRLKTV